MSGYERATVARAAKIGKTGLQACTSTQPPASNQDVLRFLSWSAFARKRKHLDDVGLVAPYMRAAHTGRPPVPQQCKRRQVRDLAKRR